MGYGLGKEIEANVGRFIGKQSIHMERVTDRSEICGSSREDRDLRGVH